MMHRTYVYIVCSPHPRVGTTLTASLLTTYFQVTGRQAVGFDTNPYDGDLARLHPQTTRIVDIAATRGQIELFDSLVVADEKPKIVDLWHPAYRRFFAVAGEVGFLEEAGRVGVVPILLYHADASQKALQACHDLEALWPDVEIAIVSNEGAAPLDPAHPGHLSRFPAEHGFRIPPLSPEALAAATDPDIPLKELLWDAPDDAPPPADGLIDWVEGIFAQFRAFELRHALQETRYLWG